VLTYLSPHWVEALDAALAAVAPPPGLAPVVVQFVVTDPSAAYHLELGGDGLHARPGLHPRPQVTFTQSRAAAELVARGRRSAQAAVLRGDVLVRGDASTLVPWRRVLGEGVGGALRELNARTRFTEPDGATTT
jgi:hypothetical protein